MVLVFIDNKIEKFETIFLANYYRPTSVIRLSSVKSLAPGILSNNLNFKSLLIDDKFKSSSLSSEKEYRLNSIQWLTISQG